MLALVSGGAASGKSEYAEKLLCSISAAPRCYIATMAASDPESLLRIEKHRQARVGRGFFTVERYTDIGGAVLPACGGVLLECVSNLVANELFLPQGAKDCAAQNIVDGILALSRRVEHLVVVSGEVCADGVAYDDMTTRYQRAIAQVNREMAAHADLVAEVVYTIPVLHKGGTG